MLIMIIRVNCPILRLLLLPKYLPEKEEKETLYKGISQRNFTRKFTLADDIIVKGAKLDNGMLTIDLERIVPEAKKPQLITVK